MKNDLYRYRIAYTDRNGRPQTTEAQQDKPMTDVDLAGYAQTLGGQSVTATVLSAPQR